MRTLAVCIATRSRPESLGRLLNALADCGIPTDVVLHVRVVDNDANGTARECATAAASLFPHGITYALEPRAGVAHVRNRLVDLGPADLVAFIDDDSWPESQWLEELRRVHDDKGADAVIGPVRAALPSDAPRWLHVGRMLDSGRPHGADSERVHWTEGGAGNILYSGRVFYGKNFRFNPAFGGTGGEDSELAARLHMAGMRIYHASNAIVHEAVSAERLTIGWLVRRRIRNGSNLERILAAMPGSGGWRWMLAIPWRFALGAWRLIRSLPLVAAGNGAETVAALLDICVVLGRIRGRVLSRRAADETAYGAVSS